MQGSGRESSAICYADIKMRKFIALVMLHDCCQIFNQTAPVQSSGKVNAGSLKGRRVFHRNPQVDLSLDQKFLDYIFRVSLCFEIFLKSTLLLRGYIIHRIDSDINKELSIKQQEYPIKTSEIDYEVFKNLDEKTIGWDLLTTPEYKNHLYRPLNVFDSLYMPPKLFESLEGIIEIRKNFQFYTFGQKNYPQTIFDDLLYIRTCYREFVVKLHNDLLEQHASEQIVGIRVQPELTGRKKNETALRRFYRRFARKQR